MKQFDQGYMLPDTVAGQVMTAEIIRQERGEKRRKEKRGKR
jgi:hypothetical protein